MRWYWIDRFIEFESGRYAKAIKNMVRTAAEAVRGDMLGAIQEAIESNLLLKGVKHA